MQAATAQTPGRLTKAYTAGCPLCCCTGRGGTAGASVSPWWRTGSPAGRGCSWRSAHLWSRCRTCCRGGRGRGEAHRQVGRQAEGCHGMRVGGGRTRCPAGAGWRRDAAEPRLTMRCSCRCRRATSSRACKRRKWRRPPGSKCQRGRSCTTWSPSCSSRCQPRKCRTRRCPPQQRRCPQGCMNRRVGGWVHR